MRSLFRVLMFAVVLAAQPKPDARPKVLVLATGGTIAGEQQEPGTLGRYEVKRPVHELVAAVPEIRKHADVETEQFSNIDSVGITPEHWLGLANRINRVCSERPDLAGIVVTHGTSRLEETAFFLYLTALSISHSFAGSAGHADPEAKGIVVAVTGLAPGERKYYEEVRKKGVLVATTFASGADISVPRQQKDVPPLIVVKHLNPLKARS